MGTSTASSLNIKPMRHEYPGRANIGIPTHIGMVIMLEVKHFFPKRVWEPTPDGWASRPVTKADTIRRELYLAAVSERLEIQRNRK